MHAVMYCTCSSTPNCMQQITAIINALQCVPGFIFEKGQLVIFLSMQLISPESHGKLGQDVLERYIQMKSSEMHSMLGQMQTFMSHHSARLRNIKPHYSFIAQVQRLSRQMEKEESPEETKAHVN